VPRGTILLAAATLAALTAGIFLPTLDFGFAYYDDDAQVIHNPLVTSLAPDNLYRMFTRFCINSYYPTRLLSYAIDYHFWRLEAKGYHLTNVVVHAANVVMLFWLLVRLMKRVETTEPAAGAAGAGAADSRPAMRWRLGIAALGAGVLAVHPVVVEPVAWVPGREELLMTFFALACLHFHISSRRAVEAGASRRRVIVLRALAGGACAMSCTSNVVGVATPLLVVAYDVVVARIRSLRPLVAGTWFLWLIGAGAIALKVAANLAPAGATPVDPFGDLTFGQRIMVVPNLFRLNLTSLVWPEDLTLLYRPPIPGGLFAAGPLAGAALLAAILAAMWWRRREALLVCGLAWFLLALGPTAQVLPHHTLRADRYLYLPLIGVATALAAALWRLTSWKRVGGGTVGLAVVATLALLTSRHLPVWRDNLTLFQHCVRLAPEHPKAHNGLGNALFDRGRLREAEAEFREALRLAPDYYKALNGLGVTLMQQGKTVEALRCFETAVRLHPPYAEARSNLGVALMERGDLSEAARQLEEARRLDPAHGPAHYNLGLVAYYQGRFADAVRHFEDTLKLNPSDADAHDRLGAALAQQGQTAQAVRYFEQALRLNPRLAQAHAHLGVAQLRLGRADAAVASLSRAVQLQPTSAASHDNLGLALAAVGRPHDAAVHYETALRLDPANVAATNHLARLLATCPDDGVRNGARAVALAEPACRLTGGRNAGLLDTLAAAYAEAGQFDEAVATAEQAAAVATEAGRPDLADMYRARGKHYQEHRPLRDTAPE
jgi:Flp pilus assembly protein TadD